jgi:site-specific DNA recombinase
MIEGRNVVVGLYARVSSEQQASDQTIASQLEALRRRIEGDGLSCPKENAFIDDGYRGAMLARPALDRMRDVAASGGLDRVYVYCPDRLARKYAYQVLLVEELRRCGVEVVFLNRAIGTSPEEDLLLQVQGIIAEYERAQILERSRRGKLHAARQGSVAVLSKAPYGYRYVRRAEGDGHAQYHVVLEEARIVRRMFEWVGRDRLSMHEVCRRMNRQGVPTPTGTPLWRRSSVWGILRNPTYKGMAAFGKTCVEERRAPLRPRRGSCEHPRYARSTCAVPRDRWISIPVPGIVDAELFAAVEAQLAENKKRARTGTRGTRYLLQGLLVCKTCGYAYSGCGVRGSGPDAQQRTPSYYRCSGTNASRFDGQRLCPNRGIRTELLDQAVWEDVVSLLSDPHRIEHEYQRRLAARKSSRADPDSERLDALIAKVKRGIARLIDAYENELLAQAEFEPRIRQARQRLEELQAEAKRTADEEVQQNELRLAVGCMQEFARKMQEGLRDADWAKRRAVLRALIKQVEVDEQGVRIIYRISPVPFDQAPERGRLRYCPGRLRTAALFV